MEERITREELLERLFHDDYENLKGAESKMVSRACAGCGAPLHGRQGTSVTCEYCGRSEQL